MDAHSVQACDLYGTPHRHGPPSGPVCGHTLPAYHHGRGVLTARAALPGGARGRQPLPAATGGPVPGTPRQAPARHRRHPLPARLAQPPVRLARTPGPRLPSQRWRAFLRHHAWDLMIRGVAADLTRGRHAFLAPTIPIVQGGWNRSGAGRWRGLPPRDAAWRSWRSAPAPGLAVWSPVSMKVVRVGQRSPPLAGRHTAMILIPPLESHRSTGPTGVRLVRLWVGGRGPARTREVPSPGARGSAGSLHGVGPHAAAVGRHNCASQWSP
jgi:hypothetical protein